jgi:hypothetical protein
MPVDAYVAFGGVAVLGVLGFLAAWFSESRSELPAINRATAIGHQRTKKKIAAEIADL